MRKHFKNMRKRYKNTLSTLIVGKLLYRQTEAEGRMEFFGSWGIQAGRKFYVVMCDFATVVNHFQFDMDANIPAPMRAQRKIRSSRIPKIASYILDNPDNYIMSAITVSINKAITFVPSKLDGSDGKAGKVIIPSSAKILVNDGQHRCAAIKITCDVNPNMETERIAVVIFEDRGLKRSQQMFADLNKHAVKPTKSLGLLYDHRDTFARFIVTLVNDVDVFDGRTEMERTNISTHSINFFTLNGVAEATKYLLKLKSKTISADNQKLVVEYWTRVSRNIPQWNLLIEKKITPHDLRKEYVHAHTTTLTALGFVGNILFMRSDWKEKLKGLQKIDWRRDSPIWQNKVVMDGKMLKNRLGIKRAANEILKNLNVQERLEAGI